MENAELKPMFIGSEQVAMVADTDRKTPMGSDIVEVTFTSGKKKFFTKKTYELVVTDIASDATIAHKVKFAALLPAVKMIICEYDLEVGEVQSFMQSLGAGIDDNFNRATNWAWTQDDSNYIPGMNPLYTRSLLDADAMIRSIPTVQEAPKPDAAA